MAFASRQTWKLIADFAESLFFDAASAALNVPAGYVAQVPTLWPMTSGEVVIDCYEDYDETTKASFGAAASGTAYIKEKDLDDTPLAFGTVTIEQVGDTGNYYVVRLSWEDDEIPVYYANKTCLIYIELDDGVDRYVIAQTVAVTDERGAQLDGEETKDIPVSVTEITGDTTPTAYPGLIIWEVDNSAAAIEVTLPSASAHAKQLVLLMPLSTSFDVTVTGTLNGDAGGAVLSSMAGGVIYSDGSAWYWLNADQYITA